MVMSQAFGGLPALLMAGHEFICLRTSDLGRCEHSLVSASVETCHLDQDWAWAGVLLCKVSLSGEHSQLRSLWHLHVFLLLPHLLL